MTRTVVQSDASKNKLVKLIYQVRDPVRIVQYTEQGSNLVLKLYTLDSSELKLMTIVLHPPPTSLKYMIQIIVLIPDIWIRPICPSQVCLENL